MADKDTLNFPLPAPMDNTVVIDDGTREYRILNRYNQLLAVVHFRPADYSMIDRCNALLKNYRNIAEPLKDISLKSDGSAAFDADWEKLKAAEAELIGQIGEIFDTDEVSAIFAKRNAFSSVGGEFFSYLVVKALTQLVTTAINEEIRLSKQLMQPYLADLEDVEDGHAGEAAQGT